MGTIKAFRRKGFTAEAIRKFMYDVGIKKSDINVSFEALASFNRELIDAKTKRYFFIENPRKIMISDSPELTIEAPLHPDNPKMGVRKFNTHQYFYVSDAIEKGVNYRFMHLFNFVNGKYHSAELDKSLKAKLIHWLPVSSENIDVEVWMGDRVVKGLGEPSLRKLKVGEVVQFERFGFVRLDSKSEKKLIFVFGHK